MKWEAELIRRETKNGFTIANSAFNIRLVFENSVEFVGRLRFNKFTNNAEVAAPLPLVIPSTVSPFRAVTDTDLSNLRSYFAKRFGFEPTEREIGMQLAAAAERNTYDPIAEYLRSLKWDGEKRIDTWLTHYLNTPDTLYTRAVGRKWLIGAVARALKPGCKMDTVLILEGEQGLKKSTALATLAGPGNFSDTPIDIGSKDGRLALQGVWIIELAELESLRKSESTRTKAFFSQQEDKYRPPFGRHDIIVPRRCVFAGSVNLGSQGYLQDETGNRRFWPVECSSIDLPALRRDRDQIWAEATQAFDAGEEWWVPENLAGLKEAVADRMEEDSWSSLIEDWLCAVKEPIVSKDEVYLYALDLGHREWSRANESRIGRILKGLGWRRRRVSISSKSRHWFYIHPDALELDHSFFVAAETRRARAASMAKKEKYERAEARADPASPRPS